MYLSMYYHVKIQNGHQMCKFVPFGVVHTKVQFNCELLYSVIKSQAIILRRLIGLVMSIVIASPGMLCCQ